MKIVVASGKGGTGKTAVATSLARLLATPASRGVALLDCDVEAPNAHLFLAPELSRREEVGIPVPVVDHARCTCCGRCAEVCAFNAILVAGGGVRVYEDLCHGCGSCSANCPEGAISEAPRVIGRLEGGPAGRVTFARGVLAPGQPMATPVIRALKSWLELPAGAIEIRDAPPGTSCPVVEAATGADFAVLVAEPTAFGLHDLRRMVEVVHELAIPTGVVINRSRGPDDDDVERFCREAGLPVLARIPLNRRIAEGMARGALLIDAAPEYRDAFVAIADGISARFGGRAAPARVRGHR